MAQTISADASPEKRLFVSLITRDISLADAFLDIVDNSINAALGPLASRLKTADDYEKLLSNVKITPKVTIDITIGTAKIVVRDNASGISSKDAAEHVFKFGRAEIGENKKDRLSVYGIGLKRAMFKCGNKIAIRSDHVEGGFDLHLDVMQWQREKVDGSASRWEFQIAPRKPTVGDLGTVITITDLYDEVIRRISDGLFINQVRELISRTYLFFLDRIVKIIVNGVSIGGDFNVIGDNYASHKLQSGTVSCNIMAGIAIPKGDSFKERSSGWYVFCNGRTVLFADHSELTGWGAGLPLFQAKHRPFHGTVFFVSPEPEDLPWTTTKSSVNEESAIWQEARREMITIGRVITSVLDRRYTEDGTEIAPRELQRLAGAPVQLLTAAAANQRNFKPPPAKSSKTTKIQYTADVSDVRRIEAHLRRPGMGGSEVGRYTFQYYLTNEVGET